MDKSIRVSLHFLSLLVWIAAGVEKSLWTFSFARLKTRQPWFFNLLDVFGFKGRVHYHMIYFFKGRMIMWELRGVMGTNADAERGGDGQGDVKERGCRRPGW